MKLSELKKQIKDNIYEILSDVNEATYMGADSADDLQKDPKFAAAKDKTQAINTLKSGGSVTLQEADPAAIKAIDAKIQNDPEFLKKTKDAMAKAEKGDTTDLATLMGGFGKMFESDDEDREPTKAELEKEKVKGAPSKFKISQEQYEKLKNTLKTVVDKVKELDKKIKDPNTKQSELKDLKDQKTRKMESLKQFIKKPELVKAFKERDVKIDTGDLIG